MSALLAHILACDDTRPAVTDGQRTLSYAALGDAVCAKAGEIRRRLGTGDRPVGLAMDNGIEWVVADIALLGLRRACVPVPPFFTADQTEAALRDAGADGLIRAGRIERLYHPAMKVPAGTAKISYTSGSTGAPKGICLSEAALIDTAAAVVDRFGAGTAGVHLALLPLGVLLENVAGLYASLLAGGCYDAASPAAVGLDQPFAPDLPTMVRAVAARGATSLILVPELLAGLVAVLEQTGMRLPGLRLVAVGGARVPVALLERAAGVGLPVVQGYGLTECGSVVTIERPGEPVRGSAGQALRHVRVTLSPAGEVLVDGIGHLGTVGRPRAAGPIATGDIGSLDDDGRLTILGRRSNLIVTGYGRNVSPEWVEAALTERPEIAQAMVEGDGAAALSALLVPAAPGLDMTAAVAAANAGLPAYARVAAWRSVNRFTAQDGTLTANGRLRRDFIRHRETKMPFFDRIIAETTDARARLLMVPQLRAGLAGRIGRETYLAYLAQAYHHVRHTVPLMEAARARLGGKPELVTALDDYIAEETGHEAWILDDIAAAGGDPARAVAEGPSVATAAMVGHAYATIRDGNPAAFFGMVFVLESTSIALAQAGADAVRDSLALPQSAFRYLTSHGALDQDHLKFFERLMNSIDDPADQAAIVAMANQVFELFGGMFAAIPLEAVDVAA